MVIAVDWGIVGRVSSKLWSGWPPGHEILLANCHLHNFEWSSPGFVVFSKLLSAHNKRFDFSSLSKIKLLKSDEKSKLGVHRFEAPEFLSSLQNFVATPLVTTHYCERFWSGDIAPKWPKKNSIARQVYWAIGQPIFSCHLSKIIN